MAELKLFDLAKPLKDAEGIQSARQQNRLGQLLEPMKVQQAQNAVAQGSGQVTDEQIKRTTLLTKVFTDTLGANFGEMADTEKQQAWQTGLGNIRSLGADMEGVPPEYTPEAMEFVQALSNRLKDSGGIDARTQNFQYLTQGLSDEEKAKARRTALGLDARAVGSSAMTIAQSGSTDAVAESEATIAGSKSGAQEKAKLEQQGRYLPNIRKAIAVAEQEGKARGEAITQLHKTEAAMPGLEEAIGELRELAPLVTNTIGGKLFDQAVKQTFFGSTEGATARAKFIAIVSNQVLPLLKETFGSAFTVAEGDSLKATMGDPDATPEEKMAQLDAFIAQKRRSLETGRREVGDAPNQQQAITTPQQAQQAGWKVATDAAGNRAYVGPNGQVVEVQ